VKDRTRKGTPSRYALKAFPESYETLEKAQSAADRINRGELFIDLRDCLEEVELE
jgi:hypothetical protein